MKLRPLICSVAAVSLMAGLSSCQNQEDVKMPVEPGVALADCETVSFIVNMPSGELKTRAAGDPTLSYGDDGLYSFTRTIDKLWYAVYNNGTLLYNSMEAGINQGIYNTEDKTFQLDLQIPRVNNQVNLNDYTVFFFAGNAADKVSNAEISDGIGLDFANKTLYAYPTFLNKTIASGDMFDPVQYDFFAKYVNLGESVNDEYKGSITLIRPFCQVSLLTDELCQPAILSGYDSNYKVAVTTSPKISTKNTLTDESKNTLPYGWNYGTDAILTKNFTTDAFALHANAFNNAEGTLTIPNEVTFKNRKMFCMASYLMLAPAARKAYDPSITDGQQLFAFTINATGDRNTLDTELKANIPSAGFKANEKYVMYNRKHNPDGSTGDPEDPDDKDPDIPGPGGPGKIFSDHYTIDVVVDPTWENSTNTVF